MEWSGYDGGCNIQDFIGQTVNLNPNFGPPLKPFVIPKVCTCYVDASDSSLMKKLPKTSWVVSIEVGEHIPKSKESEFLDNLAYLANVGLIMSWAAPGQGGYGHINEQSSNYIIDEMAKRDFRYQEAFTNVLQRSTTRNCYLEKTLLVFMRVGWSVKVLKNHEGSPAPCQKALIPENQRAHVKVLYDQEEKAVNAEEKKTASDREVKSEHLNREGKTSAVAASCPFTPPAASVKGAWTYTKAIIEKEHVGFDSGIGHQLLDLFPSGTTLTDIGAGVGQLGSWLKDHGSDVEWSGYDGGCNIQDFIGQTVNLNPNFGPALKPFVIPKVCYVDASDSSLMKKLPKTSWVVSIEVGEHIPKSKESEFLDNLAYLANVGLIMSWAAPGQGGHGHINEQSLNYIIDEMAKRDFRYQEAFTNVLQRSTTRNCYLEKTLLVFTRVGWSVKVLKNHEGSPAPCQKALIPENQRAHVKIVSNHEEKEANAEKKRRNLTWKRRVIIRAED